MMPSRMFVVVLMLAGVMGGDLLRGQQPEPKRPVARPPVLGTWEVRYIDESTMKLTILDDAVSLLTPHGTLNIPLRDIQKIQIGTRLSEAEQKAIDAAIFDLNSNDNSKREAAKAALAEFGPKALPALLRARKPLSGEARANFSQVIESLAAAVPRDGIPRDTDIIHTEESVIAGRLAMPAFRVQTFQFGEQKLKLTDVTVLQFGKLTGNVAANENVEMIELNAVLPSALRMVGKTVGVRVTAAIGGSVWGSGPYTSDSSLATAAIHAGVLKAGETGIVKIKFVNSPPNYQGSTANGVQTSDYGPFGSGSYVIVRTP